MKLLIHIFLFLSLVSAASAADPDGTIFLAAKAATLSGGGTIRFQGETNRICIGHWNGTSNTVSWTFRVPEKKTYRLFITFSCDNGQAGSKFEVAIANQIVGGTVSGTGNWGKFEEMDLGPVMLRKPGEVELVIRPTRVARNAVMNLRQVKLVPEP